MAIENKPIKEIVDTADNIRANMTLEQTAFSTTSDTARGIIVGSQIHKVGTEFVVPAISTKIDGAGVATLQPTSFSQIDLKGKGLTSADTIQRWVKEDGESVARMRGDGVFAIMQANIATLATNDISVGNEIVADRVVTDDVYVNSAYGSNTYTVFNPDAWTGNGDYVEQVGLFNNRPYYRIAGGRYLFSGVVGGNNRYWFINATTIASGDTAFSTAEARQLDGGVSATWTPSDSAFYIQNGANQGQQASATYHAASNGGLIDTQKLNVRENIQASIISSGVNGNPASHNVLSLTDGYSRLGDNVSQVRIDRTSKSAKIASGGNAVTVYQDQSGVWSSGESTLTMPLDSSPVSINKRLTHSNAINNSDSATLSDITNAPLPASLFAQLSSTSVSGFALTSDANNITISQGTATLKSADNETAPFVSTTFTPAIIAKSSLTVNTQYIVFVVDGAIQVTSDINQAGAHNKTAIHLIMKLADGSISHQDIRNYAIDNAHNALLQKLYTGIITKATGTGTAGVTPTTGATLKNLSIGSALLFWDKLPVNTPSFNTAGTDRFTSVWRGAGGVGFVETPNQALIDHTKWDNNGTQSTVNLSKYGNHIVFRETTPTGKVWVQRDVAEYATESEAVNALLPSVRPAYLGEFTTIEPWFKVTIRGDGTVVEIRDLIVSALGNNPSTNSGTPTDHQSLDNLQGGSATERYHLTLTEKTDLTDGGDSTAHYHASDRNRANHTGTQANDSIPTNAIVNDAVTNAKLANGAVTNAKIASKTINGDRLVDSTITSMQLSSNAVSTYNIANNAVTAQKINTGAVETDKLADGAVTNAKMEVMQANSIKGRYQTGGTPVNLTQEQTREIVGVTRFKTVSTEAEFLEALLSGYITDIFVVSDAVLDISEDLIVVGGPYKRIYGQTVRLYSGGSGTMTIREQNVNSYTTVIFHNNATFVGADISLSKAEVYIKRLTTFNNPVVSSNTANWVLNYEMLLSGTISGAGQRQQFWDNTFMDVNGVVTTTATDAQIEAVPRALAPHEYVQGVNSTGKLLSVDISNKAYADIQLPTLNASETVEILLSGASYTEGNNYYSKRIYVQRVLNQCVVNVVDQYSVGTLIAVTIALNNNTSTPKIRITNSGTTTTTHRLTLALGGRATAKNTTATTA